MVSYDFKLLNYNTLVMFVGTQLYVDFYLFLYRGDVGFLLIFRLNSRLVYISLNELDDSYKKNNYSFLQKK